MSVANHPGRQAAKALGRVGVWSSEIRADPNAGAAVRELEAAGWPSIWAPGGFDDKILGLFDNLLSETRTVLFASGILNIWRHEPEDVAAWWRGQSAERQGRVLIGVGISHAPLIGDSYGKPLETMRNYLTRLGAAGLPRERLCVAALGPKMLELCAELSAGAHPYLVPPEHTAIARKTMGADPLLAPEQGVILETDPAKAREIGRQGVALYTKLPNYVNSWRRLGFTDDDIANMSDRFIDSIFAWGDPAAIRRRVDAHLDAGADHVCLQVITGPPGGSSAPLDAWRALAPAML